jgi:AmmeMemoRadiSam system protein B/AmmeMemoRadiSam system protein A
MDFVQMNLLTRLRTAFLPAFLVLTALAPACIGNDMHLSGVRPPAVAGQFYPSDPKKLELAIHRYLEDSHAIAMKDPVALLVPHAGYVYSGQICADAYRQIMHRSYDVFVLLGVNHTTADFHGVSLADYESFRTPLGDVPIDRSVTEALLSECSDCTLSREVHAREHSIEVQIPFLQVLFPKARIVPVIIHPPDFDLCTRFGKALATVLKNKKALIIISSDLSHYPDAADAVRVDRKTLETIAGLNPKKIESLMRSLDVPQLETRACGEAGILAGITAAGILGAGHAVVAGYSNSGESTAGEQQRAVGYGAVAFVPGDTSSDTRVLVQPEPPGTATPLNNAEKKLLLEFARNTIRDYLETQTLPLARGFPARLEFPQGAFVTLNKNGQLRGCIGTMIPQDALGHTVGKMALYAALKDPRFSPVTLGEVKDLEIEISVLSPMQPVKDPDRIVLGRDGVLLMKGGKSAVFLPQVATEQNWNRTEMLDNLCLKAGLPEGCWKKDAAFQVFQAEVFGEKK